MGKIIFNKKIAAFTLIELLVVIAIIGILSGLIIVGMSSSMDNARIAKAQIYAASLRDSMLINLISEWKFDELVTAINNTAIQDSWSGGVNGVLYTGADPAVNKLSSDCISGKCLTFDGVDDYVDLTNTKWLNIFNNNVNNNWTVSLWMKPKNVGTDQEVFGQTNGTAMSLFLMNNGKLTLEMDDTSNYIGTNTVFENNVWHNVVVTFVNNTTSSYCRYYIDGVLDKEETKWDGSGVDASISNLFIGWQNRSTYSRNPTYFNGLIDDVRVYSATIPVSQIKEQYYAGLNRLISKKIIPIDDYLKIVKEI